MLEVASPQVTITSDRSQEGGAGSVKWDDEGVLPRRLTLVNKGVLNEVQTDRERAEWLDRNLSGKYPISFSSGNAVSDNAQMPPNIFSGNLTIESGTDEATERSILEEMEDGVYIKRGEVDVDFQLSSGSITGWAFEVKKGKRTALLNGAGILFRTIDLWKAVAKVGSKSSQRTYGYVSSKTSYNAVATASVTSSPVLFKEATVVNIQRRY
jgi:predicted Zn-dependent protease